MTARLLVGALGIAMRTIRRTRLAAERISTCLLLVAVTGGSVAHAQLENGGVQCLVEPGLVPPCFRASWSYDVEGCDAVWCYLRLEVSIDAYGMNPFGIPLTGGFAWARGEGRCVGNGCPPGAGAVLGDVEVSCSWNGLSNGTGSCGATSSHVESAWLATHQCADFEFNWSAQASQAVVPLFFTLDARDASGSEFIRACKDGSVSFPAL